MSQTGLHPDCICPRECDCQNPPPDDLDKWNGPYGVSNFCPAHNVWPYSDEECPIHGHMDARMFDRSLDYPQRVLGL